MMFTNERGERRIRVINYKFDVSPKLEPVYDSLDYLTFANIMARIYSFKLFRYDSVKVRDEAVIWLGNFLG